MEARGILLEIPADILRAVRLPSKEIEPEFRIYVQYLTKEQACLFTLQEQSKMLLDLHNPNSTKPLKSSILGSKKRVLMIAGQ